MFQTTMGFPKQTTGWMALLAMSLCVLLAGGRDVAAWTPLTEKVVVGRALTLLPEGQRRVIARHRDQLYRGVEAAHSETAPDLSLISQACDKAAALIDRRRSFKEIAYYFGGIGSLVAATADPFTAAGEDLALRDAHRGYALYVERNLHLIPFVIMKDESPENGLLQGELGLEAFLSRGQALSAGYRRHLLPAVPQNPNDYRAWLRYDVRSTPFGVSSISVSRAATRVAAVWRWVWRRAGG